MKHLPLGFWACLLLSVSTWVGHAREKQTIDPVELMKNRVYQWETDIDSVPGENEDNPRRAFLWIPPGCNQLKGLIVCGHNLIEEGILEDPLFREAMARLDFAELWVTPDMDPAGVFDVTAGAQASFNEAVDELAELSGYAELRYLPVVYLSHSSQASQPWNFGAWNPERTLAMISFHGDSPRSTYLCCNRYNPDWGDRNIDGIPGLICIGELEWNEFRIEDSFRFMRQYPGSTISLLCNAGRGHSDFSQDDLRYLIRFIQKAVEYRMPGEWDGESIMPLKKLKREEGWLADRWHKNALPTARTDTYWGYPGDRDSAYWYFDEEMARWTESIYTRERNKKKQYLTLMQDGHILKPNEPLQFTTDGYTMEVQAKVVFTDSTYTRLSDAHTIEPVRIKRIAGPVSIINDSTFRFSHYRPGTQHKRATGVELFAFAESDMFYGHAVRTISWRMPMTLNEGKTQEIKFPEIPDVKVGTSSIQLQAVSNRKLPVQYYVRSGPAYIEGNRLFLTELPPKTKYPVKVTVVAWQYGSMTEPKIQTARPVEQVFYIQIKQ
ncbi:hypothetical protein [Parabacteroides sp. PF5-6]|uniref:hypothetical protein n=1 Tax=Parabacteroides sp. PF5-6 TaxID=1742403 RepID=UPI0024069961|nr:hypothetical protein [Parabacteroides sp. PF5-6]MDF9829787.1 hypothetical protein [Parabacteroides sp. PF5-6]